MGRKTTTSSEVSVDAFTPLQQQWTTLWTTTLPRSASARSKAQNNGSWTVTVDHAFARVVLDNAIGIDKPWPQAVDAPATANMTETQLRACISLAEQIIEGSVELDTLEKNSLQFRGLASKQKANMTAVPKKRRRSEIDDDEVPVSKFQSSDADRKQTRKQQAAHDWLSISLIKPGTLVPDEEKEMIPDIQLIIASSPMKPFQKAALKLLAQIPRGRYTTYQTISNAMRKDQAETQSSHQASGHARAVGLAMRNNPYAPTVPCHRMLSSDRRIGGFHGDWEREGGFYREKMRLLVEEGIEFDEKGRAFGEPFTEFK